MLAKLTAWSLHENICPVFGIISRMVMVPGASRTGHVAIDQPYRGHFSHSSAQPTGHLSASDAGDVVPASRAPDGDRDPTPGDSQSTTITALLAEVAQCHDVFLGRGV